MFIFAPSNKITNQIEYICRKKTGRNTLSVFFSKYPRLYREIMQVCCYLCGNKIKQVAIMKNYYKNEIPE